MCIIEQLLARFPRAALFTAPTPLEPLRRLSERLGIDLWVKRDDLTSLGFGGNKVRQLEYYFGDALAQNADTILITGAVQSNYVRTAAAAANRLGLRTVIQLEERVSGVDDIYRASGNVLLGQVLGAEYMHYPDGEDETGADQALRDRAATLIGQGHKPYVIPLGLHNAPKGALGYMQAAREVLDQDGAFDAVVVASGSGLTHAGLLAGLRAAGSTVPVHGICVRRDAGRQRERLWTVAQNLAQLLDRDSAFSPEDILVWDGALAPGYGQLGEPAKAAIDLAAGYEGLFLDPVYTAKSFAGVIGLLKDGTLKKGMRVLFVHTGGLPAIFAYQDTMRRAASGNP